MKPRVSSLNTAGCLLNKDLLHHELHETLSTMPRVGHMLQTSERLHSTKYELIQGLKFKVTSPTGKKGTWVPKSLF